MARQNSTEDQSNPTSDVSVAEDSSLLELHSFLNAMLLHHHQRMTESARLFGTWFIALMSGTFAAILYEPSGTIRFFIALILASLATIVSWRGSFVITQERSFAAYFLVARRKVELAIGWQIDHPPLNDLSRWFASAGDIGKVDLRILSSPQRASLGSLAFSEADIRETQKRVDNGNGVYGVYVRFLHMAAAITLVVVLFSAGCLIQYCWKVGVQ